MLIKQLNMYIIINRETSYEGKVQDAKRPYNRAMCSNGVRCPKKLLLKLRAQEKKRTQAKREGSWGEPSGSGNSMVTCQMWEG